MEYWEHLASIRDFSIHGLHPTNPIYALPVPAREFTPWHLALGLLSRVSGLSPESALGLGGLIISVVFLYGVWEFGRAYYEDAAAPGIFLVVLLCCWGYPPLIWTSIRRAIIPRVSDRFPDGAVLLYGLLVRSGSVCGE